VGWVWREGERPSGRVGGVRGKRADVRVGVWSAEWIARFPAAIGKCRPEKQLAIHGERHAAVHAAIHRLARGTRPLFRKGISGLVEVGGFIRSDAAVQVR